MGRAQRTKGHSFERQVAIDIREIDPTAKRNVEECQEASVDIKTALPFGIQCKAFSRWHTTPHKVLEQAAGGSTESQTPIGVVKIDRKKPIVLMYWDDFINQILKGGNYGSNRVPRTE